jgi:hypothetical protein
VNQPENSPWYVEPLEQIAEVLYKEPDSMSRGSSLRVDDHGWVRFTGSVRYDQLLDGGCETQGDHFEKFSEVRRRLGLRFDIDSRSATDLGSFERQTSNSFGIAFNKTTLNDREAMFLIALPLATPERPLEKVLEEIREFGRISSRKLVEVDTSGDEPETHAPVQSVYDNVNLGSLLRSDHAEMATLLSDSQAVRSFIANFSRYKALMKGMGTSADPASDIKELAKIESALEDHQMLANTAMKLGKKAKKQSNDWWKEPKEVINLSDYSLAIALEIATIRDPRYVNHFPYETYVGVPKDMPIPDRLKLQLVVLPLRYSRDRSESMRSKNVNKVEEA